MANYTLTQHEYRYRVEGGSFTSWIGCTNLNTVDNGNGTFTITDIPDAGIAIGDFQVRVKSIGIDPAGTALLNTEAFASALDNTPLDPRDVAGLLFFGSADNPDNTVIGGKLSVLKNQEGSLGDLEQSDDAQRPLFVATGGLNNLPYLSYADGMRINMGTIDIPMPVTIYMVLKQNEYGDGKTIVDFGGGFTTGIVQKTRSGFQSLTMVNGGNWVPGSKNYYKNKWSLFNFVFNQNDSTIGADKEPNMRKNFVFDPGNNNMTNLSLGGNNNPSFDVQELVLFSGVLTAQQDLRIGNFFRDKYEFTTDSYLLSFGDSITEGAASTDPLYLSWASLLSNYLITDAVNHAVSGSTLNKPIDPNNLLGRYQSDNFVKSNTGYISLCYGTNDDCDAQWKADYITILSYFLSKGFSPNKIIIVTPPYQSNKLANLTACRQLSEEIATELGVVFADAWTFTKDNGGDSLLVDGTHPNDLGHQYMYDTIVNAIEAI